MAVSVVLLIAMALGYAQEEAKDSKDDTLLSVHTSLPKGHAKKGGESGGWGFFGPYGAMFNFDDLNTHLQAAPFHFTDKFAKNQFMFGGGGMAISDNITIGGYGFGGKQSIHSDSLHIRMAADYGGGMFELGWLPVATKHFKFGPALGLGGAGFALRATNARGYEPDFDSLLLHGARTWEISNSNFTLAPALNIMVPVSWAGIYLKVGYLLTLFDRDWDASSIELSNSPNLRASGPFASLQIMLGSSSGGGSYVKAQLKAGNDENKDKDKDKDKDDKDQDDKEQEDED
jgi:hypothetical protein